MPPWSWVPCTNGAANCVEFETTWAPKNGPYFGAPKMSRDSSGRPRWLEFTRGIGDFNAPPAEWDLYDIASGTPLAAWRGGDDPQHTGCSVEALLGQQTVTINAMFRGSFYAASGALNAMTNDPPLQRYSPALPTFQDDIASDRVFAYDLEPQGLIGRLELDSGVLHQAKGTMGLLLDMVEGDDVFAISEHGTAGWGQIYTVDATGKLALLRSNTSAHVATPASDGTRIYWTETYGSQDVLVQQARMEIWSAPYTADAGTLAATATKLAEVPNTLIPLEAVAFDGLVAVVERGGSVYVARQSDGKVIQPDPGPSRRYSQLVAVTPTELWVTESNSPGPPSTSLSRIGLGTW
jgi:hypothetical protein